LARLAIVTIGAVGAVSSAQEAAAPDPVFFEERVLPIVRGNCASPACHGNPEGAGSLRFEQAGFDGEFTPRQATENYRAALAFVRPGAPQDSLLLRKPLREPEGGLRHGGGSYDFGRDSEEYAALAAWIRGERLSGVPPVLVLAPVEQAVPRGSRVRLDAKATRDRRGAPLAFRWSVLEAPDGSKAALERSEAAVAWITPDVEGPYAIEVRVENGEAEATATVAFSAESLPYVRIEVEAGELVPPLETRPDLLFFVVGEAGEYQLWVRARPIGAGGTLLFSVDEAKPLRWTAPPAESWVLAPVAGTVTSRRRDLSGRWLQEDGVLVGSPGRRGPGAAVSVMESRISEGTVEVTAMPPAPTGEEGPQRGAFVFIGPAEGARGIVAGITEGGSRWVIAGAMRGRPEILAEKPGPNSTQPVRFSVSFDRRRVRLLHEGLLVLEAAMPPFLAGRRARFQAGGAMDRAAAPSFAVGLMASGEARFDDLVVKRRGEVEHEDDFEGRGGAIRLAEGPHGLTIGAESGSVAVDQVLFARASAGSDLSAEDRGFLRAIHFDLIRRPPTEIELLTCGGDREGLARRLAGSLEFWQSWYEEELYYFLLLDNFRPATAALAGLPVRLARGSIHVLDAVREIVISQSFNLRNPGPDTFVSVVLEQLLGIRVQDEPETLEAGKKMYDGYESTLFGRNGRSQADLVEIAMAQEAFAPRYLHRFHEGIFGAPMPAEEGARWVARLRADPGELPAILAEWVSSPAYGEALASRRPKTDRMFVQGLFVDLLGRPPTVREFRNMRNALEALSDPRPVRSVLARVIVDSGQVPLPRKDAVDPESWIASQFLRFLGRAPAQPELETYLEAWREESCTPATVLVALVTSDEYQTY
jgi:hypothetical protein